VLAWWRFTQASNAERAGRSAHRHIVSAALGFGSVGRIRVERTRGFALPAGLVVGMTCAMSCNEACAAGVGTLSSSIGLLAVLAALSVVKAWPAHLINSAWPAVGGALLVAGGAAWFWRARVAVRLLVGSGVMPALVATSADLPVAQSSVRTVDLPQDFDRVDLMTELRLHFVSVQAAWDKAEMGALSALTTPEMLRELCLDQQGCQAAHDAHRTDVVTLHAELLGFDELSHDLVLTVEFSGLLREGVADGARPFREVWLLTKPKGASCGWRLARHQALF
jgi:predicted lipid-binding transport protein (Tim44 family)